MGRATVTTVPRGGDLWIAIDERGGDPVAAPGRPAAATWGSPPREGAVSPDADLASSCGCAVVSTSGELGFTFYSGKEPPLVSCLTVRSRSDTRSTQVIAPGAEL